MDRMTELSCFLVVVEKPLRYLNRNYGMKDNRAETRTALNPIHLPANYLIERGHEPGILALSSNSSGRHELLLTNASIIILAFCQWLQNCPRRMEIGMSLGILHHYLISSRNVHLALLAPKPALQSKIDESAT